MADNADKAVLDVLRRELKREHDLLSNRANFFLVWQAILMAGLAIGPGAPAIATVVCLLGLMSSMAWLYIGCLNRAMLKRCWTEIQTREAQLPEDERLFTAARKYRVSFRGRIFGLSVSKCLAYLFPLMWALTWAAILALVVSGHLHLASSDGVPHS